jgi:hypothetical protein
VISHSKIFTIFQRTDDPYSTGCPNETTWYSPEDGGVYCTYMYKESGTLQGYLDKPYGLDVLMNETYGINGSVSPSPFPSSSRNLNVLTADGQDISKSSARAFRVSGFNFTQDDSWQQLSDALASNSTSSPFLDGPGWTGTFTLPVCDIGTNNWTTAYGDTSPGRFGKLPCCCGKKVFFLCETF